MKNEDAGQFLEDVKEESAKTRDVLNSDKLTFDEKMELTRVIREGYDLKYKLLREKASRKETLWQKVKQIFLSFKERFR